MSNDENSKLFSTIFKCFISDGKLFFKLFVYVNVLLHYVCMSVLDFICTRLFLAIESFARLNVIVKNWLHAFCSFFFLQTSLSLLSLSSQLSLSSFSSSSWRFYFIILCLYKKVWCVVV